MMRLFLLPISTKRTLIYCERLRPANLPPGAKPPISERVINKVNETWVSWEKAEKGWQKTVTNWGNQLFKRIPYEEWGLKSIPPATKKRLEEVDQKKITFKCEFPAGWPDKQAGQKDVSSVLKKLATERQSLHWQRLVWCIVGLPVTFPFTFAPIIPNLPFYYLCFRAWSHYRALYGGKMLEYLVTKDLIEMAPSQQIKALYKDAPRGSNLEASTSSSEISSKPAPNKRVDLASATKQEEAGEKELLIINEHDAEAFAHDLKLPELQVELERAVAQVSKALESEKSKQENNAPKATQVETEKQR